MAGRPRDPGAERYPDGRKKPTSRLRREMAVQAPTLLARVRMMGWDMYEKDEGGKAVLNDAGEKVISEDSLIRARDERLSTVFGVLAVEGKITDDQYQAAKRYNALMASWRKSISAPPPTARNAAIQVVPDILDGEAIPNTTLTHDEWCEMLAGRYNDVIEALRPAGRRAKKELARVCKDPCLPPERRHDIDMDLLKSALDCLVDLYRG